MFERYTERARQVVVLAQKEAINGRSERIDAGHLLLGLLREGEGVAAQTLTNLGLEPDAVLAALPPGVPLEETYEPKTPLPFSKSAQRVHELALREALSRGSNYIGTEHLLLALIRDHEGVPALVLSTLGFTPQVIREEVMRLLSGRRRPVIEKVAPPEAAEAPLRFLRLLAAFVDLDGDRQGDVPVMIGTLETRVSVSELRDLLEKIR